MKPAKKAAMLAGFDNFTQRVMDRYAEARAALEQDDYVGAQRILAGLATSHAKTSLSLRNVLIQDGVIGDNVK